MFVIIRVYTIIVKTKDWERLQEKYGKPGGRGGQCKMSVINRGYPIIFWSRCAEG